jgi:hypothetical protein
MTALAAAGCCALAAVVLLPGAIDSGQTPTLRIAAPTETTYLSGPARLVAVIEPPSRTSDVREVMFFADGKQVCRIARPPFDCEWDAGERVIEHQIRIAAELVSGERLVETVRTQGLEYSEAVDVDVVQVTVVVSDGERFVRGLQQRDFKVYDNDRVQPITSFADEKLPLELVTAVDVSSSMKEALPSVKRATDQNARVQAIDRMAPWGGTALYDVTIRALDLLGRQTGRRSIVLFTDGDDQSSYATLEAAIARTEGSDATIYAIGQGRAVKSPVLQDLLRRLATISGGRAFFTNDELKLDKVFEEILEDLRSQYVISYPAPGNQRDGAWHRIRVEVSGGKYRVRTRQGYRFARN